LAGGGGDVDAAMKWFLGKAQGGDVIVIREGKNITTPSTTADAYNPYLYTDLGMRIDSVETIFLNSRSVADNPEVAQKIRNAEAIFFTGNLAQDFWIFFFYNI
jgi:cyanophycinase